MAGGRHAPGANLRVVPNWEGLISAVLSLAGIWEVRSGWTDPAELHSHHQLLFEPTLTLMAGEPGYEPLGFSILPCCLEVRPEQEGWWGQNLLEPIGCIFLLQPLKARFSGFRSKVQLMTNCLSKFCPLCFFSPLVLLPGSPLYFPALPDSPSHLSRWLLWYVSRWKAGKRVSKYVIHWPLFFWMNSVIGTDLSLCSIITEA